MLDALPFHVVGVSHHTSAVGVRERFVLPADQLAMLLVRENLASRSALVLTTCNRSELYWSGDRDAGAWFLEYAMVDGGGSESALTRLEGSAAVRHLFTVSAGLDSQILGETEILGQVRQAYDQARAAGTTTRAMDAIFSAALTCGRRIRHETLLGRHPASVSSAAVGLAADRLGGLDQRDVVVLGAGEAAEGVLRALDACAPRRVTLVNRNAERARVLAAAWGAESSGWNELDVRVAGADLVFVATGAARPVVTAAQLDRAIGARDGHEITVMDLSVPRNVELDARGIAGIRLFDLDDLQRLCCPAAGIPSAALFEAQRVLEEELLRLDIALRSLAAAPRLAELHRLGAEVAAEEIAWALSQLDALGEREREVVRRMADRLVRRVLYPVSKAVRTDE
ncbi:MAG: glutamyl-tRNA reductase [Gemmatimonadales bacterium]|nr:glutamyl-tRNA reductase [Gemmatimonadales bacterium]